MQKANCDGLGIGLQLKALHQQIWKTLDWNDEYSKIIIKPHIQVKIKTTGY
ncbi:Ger(x)C family spore germination C-terminal domain-containing protein [Paenibacillus radicis (ex Gao et al. 2016)]|uniref:Ger(x)C family spore germination C-terminal domain-containing protein n=1 Tax=Paenibacillus radicis (ex Gao et al. 2016) TaxID=1737354 RepID=UPI00166AC3DF